MVKDNSIQKVMVIFLGITLLGSSFTAYSGAVFAVAPGDFIDTFVTGGSSSLDKPYNMQFGPDGNLYVSSFQSDEVLRYNAITGVFIDTFVTAGSGGIDGPDGISFGPDGNLYVSSYSTHEVLRYNNNTGAFIDAFVSAGSGGLDKPYDLHFVSDGKLYVTSETTDEVLRYDDTTGAFIDAFVSAGSGGLDKPYDLLFGPNGNFYVTSSKTHEVLRYNGTTGAFINAFVSAGSGGLDSPDGISFGPDGNLYVGSEYSHEVLRYNGTTGAFIDAFVPAGSGGLSGPLDVPFGPDGNLYVTSYQTDEVLRYNGTTGAFIDSFLTDISGGLDLPKNLAYGPDGNLYVLSFQNDKVLRYDGTTGAFIDSFVTSGSGGLDGPQGLDFAADGKLYISSEYTDEVLRYDGTTGAFIDVFVTANSGGLNNPQESTFGPDGNLYVTSYFTHEVFRYNGADGSFIDAFVSAGSGGLDTPQGLEFGSDGNLYIVSENNNKVLRYDGTTGSFIDAFATIGGGTTPKDLTFGLDGNLYVTVNSFDKVKRFDGVTGAFMDNFVTPGSGGLDSPQGLAFGPDDNLYVTSQNTNEILRYEKPLLVDAPPTVSITTPDDNDSFVEGTSITFSGSATDLEDGGLSNLIHWTSDDDGLIGVGGSITNSSLSIGSHVITASVTDSFGNMDSHSHPIMVTAAPCTSSHSDILFIDCYSSNAGWTEIGTVHVNHSTYSGVAKFLNTIGGGGVNENRVYKQISATLPADYWIAEFDYKFLDSSIPSHHPFVVTTTSVDVMHQLDPDRVIVVHGGGGLNQLQLGPAGAPQPGAIPITVNTQYYLKLEKTPTELILNVYSDSARTNPIPNSPFVYSIATTDLTNLNYIAHAGGKTSGSARMLNAEVDNTVIYDVSAPTDDPPTVSITSPVDGDNYIEGTSITFSGSATDLEDGGISNTIDWKSSIDGYLGTGEPLTNSSLSVGTHTITASVTDSFGNTSTDSHSIMITAIGVDNSPTISITTPTDGDIFVNGTLITLSGIATDSEDGDISANMTWTSDLYGVIGNGSSVSSSTAPIGTHTITASVTDSFGNHADSSITMTIVPVVVDASPDVSIVSPSEGSVYINGTSVTFSGTAMDSEDGDLAASLTWDSTIEGLVGTGDSFTYSNFTVGTHTIEAKVTDSYGNSMNDVVTMIITEEFTELVMVCHFPPGNPLNPQQLMIPITAVQSHLDHGDTKGTCVDNDDELEKQAVVAKIKKQSKDMRDKNELDEKRQALKEIKKEFRDFKKELKGIEKQKIKDVTEEIKEVIKELKKNPEYDKEFKQILKDELKETKLEIKREMNTQEKIFKNKIDSKVHSLLKSDNPDRDAKKLGFDFKDGKTKVVIKLSDENQEIVNQLNSIGKVNIKNDKHVQLTIKVSDLPKLNSISGIDKIRSPFSAVQFYEELSEGVYFINADLAHFAGITGEGIKAAVLDLAFADNEKISDNVVQVKSFRQGIGYLPIQGSGSEASHGTAVAEIIADVAPDVELYLYSMETDIEFIAAVDEAMSQQVDVIAMSAGWPNFPTDGTSHITQKIEEAVENGIVFVVPSGNFANKHWQGNFADSNFNNWHEYSNSDEGLTISVTADRITEEKPIVSYLMWDVGMGDVADFEMVLVDPLGQIVDYSANEQKTKSDTAFEYIHHIPDTEGTYSIGILYAGDMSEVSKRPNASLEIFSVNDELEHPVTQSSVSVPADANGAIVVGAINHLDGTLEPFSSQGPTNNGKLAPHVVGPDGVTTLALGDKPFYGTSATAPYVAGIAILMLQSNPEMSPEQILNEIQQNADSSNISLGNEYDYSSGYGSASAFFLIEDLEVTG